tara:strand:- start:9503 stop:9892 length:390 start_codon:yes stop_codon:yes gene_type:complete
MDRHYDLTYLNQVFHGNEAMVRQIVELFLKQAPAARLDMMQCVRQSRLQDLHPIAHQLKSSVKMLGLSGLEPMVLNIERCSKFAFELNTLPGLVSELCSSMDLVCNALTQDLSEVFSSVAPKVTHLRRA